MDDLMKGSSCGPDLAPSLPQSLHRRSMIQQSVEVSSLAWCLGKYVPAIGFYLGTWVDALSIIMLGNNFSSTSWCTYIVNHT